MSFSCRQWQAGPVVAAGALVVALTVGPAQAQDKTITMKITTPTKNSGGMTAHWIAPNCTPSIWRGIEPSWLAG